MDEAEVEDLSNTQVVEKYKAAAEIAFRAMEKVVSECKAGRRVVELCKLGDDFVEEAVKKPFPKADIERGIAFPTSIAVNNVAGNFSPLSDDKTVLAKGDVVKIDVGAHLDGYLAVNARTIIVEPEGEVKGKAADAIAAAQLATQAAIHLLKTGHTNEEISDVIKRVAEAYHVTPLEGVLSHQMSRYVIDGEKVIMNRPMADQRVEKCEIAANDVWCLDVVMSTGAGTQREMEQRPTIYKRNPAEMYPLKLKAARQLLARINERSPVFPFTLRAFDEKTARLGISEMLTHGVVDPYPVLYERTGEFVAQFKTTVFVLPRQTLAAFTPALPAYVKSEYTCEDEVVKKALAEPLSKPKPKPKKKKGAKKAAAAKKEGEGKEEKEEEEEGEEEK